MNFGCGTLVGLLFLVVVAGKLIPHGSGVPAPTPASQGVIKGQASGGVVRERSAKSPAKTVDDSQEPSLETMLSGLKTWLDEKASEAEQHVIERAALPAGPAAEVLAKVGEEAKTLVTQRIAEVTAPKAPPSQPVSPEKAVNKPTLPGHVNPAHALAPSSVGAKIAVEGRDPVFNNPWNHAVEPVERYLKQHVHDAASIEMLEWGQVEVVREGYQVRCIYKSKNVLGKMTTQSRLFILDHLGKVIDIRD